MVSFEIFLFQINCQFMASILSVMWKSAFAMFFISCCCLLVKITAMLMMLGLQPVALAEHLCGQHDMELLEPFKGQDFHRRLRKTTMTKHILHCVSVTCIFRIIMSISMKGSLWRYPCCKDGLCIIVWFLVVYQDGVVPIQVIESNIMFM